MKNIIYLVIAVLGMVVTTSCSSLTYAQGGYYGYGYGYGTVQQMPSQSGLFVASRNITPTGTFVVGKKAYPVQLRWANMSLVKQGMMVYVLDASGSVINQYDLRISRQDIEDEFRPTGLTGKALQVSVCVTGGRGFNAVIVNDGNHRETYYLNN